MGGLTLSNFKGYQKPKKLPKIIEEVKQIKTLTEDKSLKFSDILKKHSEKKQYENKNIIMTQLLTREEISSKMKKYI